jgi:AhpD family alkylhydroperoxidase
MSTPSPCYDKPTWTLAGLARVLPELPRHLGNVLPTVADHPITGRLREKIMLAVAAENRCVYCQVAHAAFGRSAGLPEDEIRAVLAGEDGADATEALALAYARDLARRGFASRDERLRERLAEVLGAPARDAVESSAHVMNLANRFGNTFDAGLAALRGQCVQPPLGTLDVAVISACFLAAAAVVSPVVAITYVTSSRR